MGESYGSVVNTVALSIYVMEIDLVTNRNVS